MSDSILMSIIVIAGVSIVLLGAKLWGDSRGKNWTDDSIFAGKRKKRYQLWYRVNGFASNFVLTRWYTRTLNRQLEVHMPGDKQRVMEITGKMLLAMGASLVSLAAIIVLLQPSLFFVVCAVIVIFVSSKQATQWFISRNDARLLYEMEVFIELVQFHFLQCHMIDEAIKDSMNGKNKVIERHAKMILAVMCSDDYEIDLAQYLNSVSNPFLRELTCICITTHVYGDNEMDGRSRFLESLKGLKGRIGDSRISSREISYNFKFLTVLCVLPVFTLDWVKNWAIGVIPELEAYYAGYAGMISIIACFLVGVACYAVVNRLKDAKMADLSDHHVLKSLYWKKPIKKLVDAYYNRNYGKFLQHEKLLRMSGSNLNANLLMIRRALFAVVALVGVIVFAVGMHAYTKNRITSQVTGNGSKSSMATEEDSMIIMLMVRGYTEKYLESDLVGAYNAMVDEAAESDVNYAKATSIDANVKAYFKTVLMDDFVFGDGCTISDEVAMSVAHQYNTEHWTTTKAYTKVFGRNKKEQSTDDVLLLDAQKQLGRVVDAAQKPAALGEQSPLYTRIADDVAQRVVDYQNAHFSWVEMLAAVSLAIVAFWVPYFWIVFTMRDSQHLMDDEVMQYQALILILMPIKVMSTSIIMDWMYRFSSIFRKGIHKCIMHLNDDEMKAFDELLEAEPYSPFQDLIRKLQMCDKVGVQKAFYNMDVMQNNFCEYRKQEMSKKVKTDSAMAAFVAMAPIMFVIAVYLIFPFLKESFGQLSVTMSQLSTM